jgi:acyl-CoA thioester hydrolase
VNADNRDRERPKKLVYVIEVPVRWGDMDAMGHVNNAVYFRYFEQGRISWFESIGAVTRAVGSGPILVAAACNFRVPVVFPDTVEIRTFAGAPGRSSIPLYQEIRRASDASVLFADGHSTIAWVDFQVNKSVPLPEAVRALLAQA